MTLIFVRPFALTLMLCVLCGRSDAADAGGQTIACRLAAPDQGQLCNSTAIWNAEQALEKTIVAARAKSNSSAEVDQKVRNWLSEVQKTKLNELLWVRAYMALDGDLKRAYALEPNSTQTERSAQVPNSPTIATSSEGPTIACSVAVTGKTPKAAELCNSDELKFWDTQLKSLLASSNLANSEVATRVLGNLNRSKCVDVQCFAQTYQGIVTTLRQAAGLPKFGQQYVPQIAPSFESTGNAVNDALVAKTAKQDGRILNWSNILQSLRANFNTVDAVSDAKNYYARSVVPTVKGGLPKFLACGIPPLDSDWTHGVAYYYFNDDGTVVIHNLNQTSRTFEKHTERWKLVDGGKYGAAYLLSQGEALQVGTLKTSTEGKVRLNYTAYAEDGINKEVTPVCVASSTELPPPLKAWEPTQQAFSGRTLRCNNDLYQFGTDNSIIIKSNGPTTGPSVISGRYAYEQEKQLSLVLTHVEFPAQGRSRDFEWRIEYFFTYVNGRYTLTAVSDSMNGQRQTPAAGNLVCGATN